ncbi:hypothetical protein G7Y89_g2840 [Cudoniella acicularis]|uniref:Heterokaryon incompatibility domain-containing protein n=1 Tax=Cudoniella acicularis TaxID=354080 RepID=A0A8H4RVJ1_9HELO|nr:hypothetical protein G7Y89_g2840 [Cudoniella acicularis]
MSSYRYSPLPDDNIRLLCLLPYASEAEPLQCKLLDYNLQDPSGRTPLYDALSYVWGDPNDTRPIYIVEDKLLGKDELPGKDELQVTTNLYAALSHLRNFFFQRIIWVDAICIDQGNSKERQQQILLMAKIYSQAICVLVWLGEETEDTDGALEDIRLAANKELTASSKKGINQQAVLALLERPWFQRIWVLQEVAAARHIVMICGPTEIDGYAFCLGVRSLKLSYTASPKLQTLPSVIHLITGAGLRSKHTTYLPKRFSLNIRCLADLIDMFHTRQATDTRDKVYALLGMSSDDPSPASLQPDYTKPWEELFEQLIKFVLGKDIFVETSSQRAIIKSKGCILGQVSSITRDDRHNVNITSRNSAWDLGGTTEWTLQASAIPIQEHDIICLLYGVSKPMIIRLCKDHFAVVVIAATPLNGSSSFGWPETSQPMTQFLRDFLLVWDWENPQGQLHDQGEYKTLIQTHSQALEYSKAESGGYLDKATRLWNDVTILDDLREYDKADERLLEARSGYVAAFEKEYLPKLVSQYGRTLLSFAAGEGHEDIIKLLLEIVDPDIKDGKSGRTPLLWAATNGHEAVVKLLLETGQVDVDSKDTGGSLGSDAAVVRCCERARGRRQAAASRRARSTFTRRIFLVGRRYRMLLRKGTRPSSSC